jgi:GWxTD domain-containing protein
MIRRYGLSLAIVLISSLLFGASSLPDLFLKAKEQFRAGAYERALATLEQLDRESQISNDKAVRLQLLPALQFYRGAALASLGRTPEAIEQFQLFLAQQPNANLDPAMYAPAVIRALEEARKQASKNRPNQETPESTIVADYQSFRAPEQPLTADLDERWGDGPVHYLMTPEEHKAWRELATQQARGEWVANFWKRHDPSPETPANEFRAEFAKRVAFADSRFRQGETRGSLTDRGMVFILVGPPTYIGRKPLQTGDDANDSSGLSRYSGIDIANAVVSSTSSEQRNRRIDAMTGPTATITDVSAASYLEIWHYRKERLPKNVPYLQVDFQFVTRRGYGQEVLQREPRALETLDRARGLVPGAGH